MSDERLRRLERQWRETGAVEDEAAYLLERVRIGDLFLFAFGYESTAEGEASECVWIEAPGAAEALAWGQTLARAYCAHHFPQQPERRPGDYAEWIDGEEASLDWAARAGLPRCRVGELPDWEGAS